MTWPTVVINQLNEYAGTTTEIERVLLYLGTGATNVGQLIPVNNNSDLDTLLGEADSILKSNVAAARSNGGQSWFGYVWPLAAAAETTDWVAAVKTAMATASVEGFVLVKDIDQKTDINAAITLRSDIIGSYGRWLWSILSVGGPGEDETWAEYVTRFAALQDGIAGISVQLVPRLWGNEPGALAGRLCNRSVTIADSPARVKTGPVINLGSDELPVDGEEEALTLATLQALAANRASVPMWYPDYDGIYWADGLTLDVDGGDYQAIEYVRIADKVARRTRLRAIPKIADRSLNSTAASVEFHQTYFAATLREMAKRTQINGITFPGEVKTPQNGDVVITWISSTKVQVYIVARPYESSKTIEINILLDTSLTE
ncbi:DUF2586 domain-containing protein [Sodalis sp. RH18]|uniref:DUF2586 domain-containing protein n=1 Tax=Sodalis sp. RH18 TaxID=3394333 RepID=UPI0039B4F470